MTEHISNQVSTITQSLREYIKSMSSQNSNKQQSLKEKDFDAFIKSTSDMIAVPPDLTPFYMEKYQSQSNQLKDLNADVTQFKDDIENIIQKFNQNVEEEKLKFYQNASELSTFFYDQMEMQNSNHDVQISKLKDAMFSLKAEYEKKCCDAMEKASIETKLLNKVNQNDQKNYDEKKITSENISNKACRQTSFESEIDINDKDSIKSNSLYESDEKQDDDINYTTGSSEIKIKASLGNILNKIDEIEQTEEANENLKKQINDLKAKNELEIGDLKQRLEKIDSESESNLNNQLKVNQKKYDDEFEATKLKYVQREKELIDQFNNMKKEQSTTTNALKAELSKLKDISNALKTQITEKLNNEKENSQKLIKEKENELQNIKEQHDAFVLELLKQNETELKGQKKDIIQSRSIRTSDNSISSSLLTNPRRKRMHSQLMQPDTPQLKTLQSPRRKKLQSQKEDFSNSSEITRTIDQIDMSDNESLALISQYTDLKQKLENKIIEQQSISSMKIAEIEQATKLAQTELVDLMNKLTDIQNAIEKEAFPCQTDEIHQMKDEIARLRVVVNKRKTLQALQSHHHQEIEKIEKDLESLSKNSVERITKINNNMSDKLTEEQLMTNEFIKEAQIKLQYVLKELQDAEINEEGVALKDQQNWCDLRNNMTIPTKDLCTSVRRVSRPTSSIAKAPPFLSNSRLPHLQK